MVTLCMLRRRAKIFCSWWFYLKMKVELYMAVNLFRLTYDIVFLIIFITPSLYVSLSNSPLPFKYFFSKN